MFQCDALNTSFELENFYKDLQDLDKCNFIHFTYHKFASIVLPFRKLL